MRWIDQIVEVLPELFTSEERRQNTQRYVDQWTRWVLAYPHGWRSAVTQSGTSLDNQPALDQLATLGELIDAKFPQMHPQAESRLPDALAELVTLLADSGHLPLDLRRHLAVTINHVRSILDEHRITSDFDLSVAVDRLMMAVGYAAYAEPDADRKSKLKTWMSTWMSAFTAGGASSLSAGLLLQILT